jgi:hypothetical protein
MVKLESRGTYAVVVDVMASDVLAPSDMVVATPGTEVSLAGVVVLLEPHAARPARMPREMVAGTMMRLIMMCRSFVWEEPQKYPLTSRPKHCDRSTTIDSLSVENVQSTVITIVPLKLRNSHCADRHGEAEKDAPGKSENSLINRIGLNDREAQDHPKHHEEDDQKRPN